jgi:hypothetical protein
MVLVVLAARAGSLQTLHAWPEWELFGTTRAQIFANVCAVIPILATAYTCQMTAHFVVGFFCCYDSGQHA